MLIFLIIVCSSLGCKVILDAGGLKTAFLGKNIGNVYFCKARLLFWNVNLKRSSYLFVYYSKAWSD